MALSANTARVYESGIYNDLPVKASEVIYEGSAVGMTAGYARALAAGDIFGGFAQAKVTGGSSSGDVRVNVIRSGLISLAVTSVAVTDIGKAVYASDDGTFTLTQGSNTRIGTVDRFVSSGVAIVAFEALGSGGSLTGITVLTDSSGGAAANGTIDAVTAPTAIGATLTDSTGDSGTHDDTVADGLTATAPASITEYTPHASGGTTVTSNAATDLDTTAAALNTLVDEVQALQVIVAACVTDLTVQNQNDSDIAQKVIELVATQAQNRTAIVALTDAVTELATKVNAIINAQD